MSGALVSNSGYQKKHTDKKDKKMLATKKFVEKEIEKLNGENIYINDAKPRYSMFGLVTSKTIKECFDRVYERIDEIEKQTQELKHLRKKDVHSNREMLKDIDVNKYSIDTFKGYIVSFENEKNALEYCDKLLKKGIPFKMGKKLKKAYIEQTKGENNGNTND